jgi:hypothetical protein
MLQYDKFAHPMSGKLFSTVIELSIGSCFENDCYEPRLIGTLLVKLEREKFSSWTNSPSNTMRE